LAIFILLERGIVSLIRVSAGRFISIATFVPNGGTLD
jgi:hypothetical protein